MASSVFQDLSGRRWMKIKLSFFTSFFFLCILLLLFMLDFYQKIDFPYLQPVVLKATNIVKYVLIGYLSFAIIVGFMRLFLLLFFSTVQWRMKRIQRRFEQIVNPMPYEPHVTVIVPVYNEEVVIKRTVNALLESQYPINEILVIDDGSTDRSAEIVEREFHHRREVELIRKKNGGKSSVLNLGFRLARGDIIVTIDADTIFTEHAISRLVSHFRDPTVAAVSGNCKIGNIRNQLTLWQHIEYVTINNLERRACEVLNCIMVVPGSNSAWRKSVVKEVGYFDLDTLAEDTDVTIKIINKGYRVMYDDRAISFEECPEKVRAFIKQRFRWSYGILQCAWKHKRNLLRSNNKVIKYFAASMVFSYFLFLTSPLVDIIFMIAFITGTRSILLFALLFYLSDVLAPAFALKLEKEKMKPLIWVFVQRMAYRYLIAYVTWKTVLTALKGSDVGWGKLKRSGGNLFS